MAQISDRVAAIEMRGTGDIPNRTSSAQSVEHDADDEGCWYTYSYPDEVVLAVDDERRSLISQLEEAREVGHGQAMRIRDLERGLRDEMQRADALRRQLQDTHQHLFAVKRQLKERVRSISMDCEVILDMAAEAPSRATGPEGMDEVSHRPCRCWYTYSYPDEVVLAVDDERRSLISQLEEAREVGHGQAMRIRDLERGLRDEMQRADALRRQLQDTHQHLFAVKRQLKERVRSISMDCEVILDMAAEAPSRATGPEGMDEVSHRPCRCWYTYSYPDEVVLAVDDERRSLISQLEEAREVGHGQAMRIRDLERGLRDEMQRADALRRQLQDTHQHLFAVKRQLKERVRSISMDCEVILDMAAEAPSRATGPEGMDEVSHRPCRCWYTYSYPDEVVLAVDDERRSLISQLEEAREVGHGQAMRIRDLERGLRDEMQRADALRRQLQDTHQHLFAVKSQLKERVRSISMDCETCAPKWTPVVKVELESKDEALKEIMEMDRIKSLQPSSGWPIY
nr:uncharacterized protein LOC113729191 [Coffea arabica]